MEALLRFLPGPQPALVRYGVTAIVVLVAFSGRLGIGDGTGRYGFIHFILPVVLSSLLFGRAAGFFATVFSAVLVGVLLDWKTGVASHISAMAVYFTVCFVLVLISEGLRTALAKAHAAQEATDLLLQEMSHRVKNKFAMITSIIGLQSRNATPEVKQALDDIAARIKVMATVHNFLQLSRHSGLIDMSEYLPKLGHALREALCGPRPIVLVVNSSPIQMPPDKALTIGLIVNELVTNAFKYAFSGDQAGTIYIELRSIEDELELAVTDNGQGCKLGGQTGLGTRLVTVLAAQLGGKADCLTELGGGCRATVRFPLGPSDHTTMHGSFAFGSEPKISKPFRRTATSPDANVQASGTIDAVCCDSDLCRGAGAPRLLENR